MRLLALEAGDAATWGSTVVTFGMACYAIAQGLGQKRDLRRQNELQAETSQLQRRQIETAERRTLVMEQLLAQLTVGERPSPSPPGLAQGGAPDEQQPVARPAQGADYGSPAPRPQPHPDPDPHLDLDQSGPPPPLPAQPQQATGAGPSGPAALPVQPPPFARPARVGATWRVERQGQHGFALRNLGPETLTGVRVSRANLPDRSIIRGLPENAVVRAGETVEFLITGAREHSAPPQILVSWHGQSGEVLEVPVPVPGR